MHTALILLRALFVDFPFNYASGVVYVDKAVDIDMIADILTLCYAAPLPVYVFVLQSVEQQFTFTLKDGNGHDLNVYLLHRDVSMRLLSAVESQLFPADDNMFVLQFDDLDDAEMRSTLFAYRGLNRALLLSPTVVRSINRFAEPTRLLLDAETEWSDVAAIRTYAEQNIWEDDIRWGGLDYRGAVLEVFMKVAPYRSSVYEWRELGTFYMVGPDAFVAQHVIAGLRATGMLYTDFLLPENVRYVDVLQWHSASFMERYERRLFYASAFTNQVIRNFTYDRLDLVDLYLTATPLQDNSDARFVHLYPHLLHCWYFVVPTERRKRSFLQKVAAHRVFQLAVLITGMLLVVRLAMLRMRAGRWLLDGIYALGVCLAQSRVRIRSRPESLWLMVTLPFSLFAMVMLGAASYGILLIDEKRLALETVDEMLEDNDQLILAPYELDNRTLPEGLKPRIVYDNEMAVMSALFAHRNLTLAILLDGVNVNYYMDRYRSFYAVPVYRLVPDPLCTYCRCASIES